MILQITSLNNYWCTSLIIFLEQISGNEINGSAGGALYFLKYFVHLFVQLFFDLSLVCFILYYVLSIYNSARYMHMQEIWWTQYMNSVLPIMEEHYFQTVLQKKCTNIYHSKHGLRMSISPTLSPKLGC